MTEPRVALKSGNEIAETLLITLYVRAMELRQPEPLLRDETAAALVDRLDYDFSRIRLLDHDRAGIVVRVRQFDSWTRAFMAGHPGAPVVSLGCGLDTRFERIDDGRVVWYDLDLPEVMAVRQHLLPGGARQCCLASSVFDPSWMDAVEPSTAPPLFVAEGMLPYFTEAQVRGLVLALRERFPGAELITDAMTPLMVRSHNLELRANRVEARLRWGLKHPRDLEAWAPGIRLLDQWHYLEHPEPRLARVGGLRHAPFLARGVVIYRYLLGQPDRIAGPG